MSVSLLWPILSKTSLSFTIYGSVGLKEELEITRQIWRLKYMKICHIWRPKQIPY